MFLDFSFLFLITEIQMMIASGAVTSQYLDLQRMTAIPIIEIVYGPKSETNLKFNKGKKNCFYSMWSQYVIKSSTVLIVSTELAGMWKLLRFFI